MRMSNNFSVTDKLTEEKINIDTRMKYSKSQPSLTTSRCTERSRQRRQHWVIYSKQANLNFIFFFFSFILILYYAERQITGFKGVTLLDPDCDLQGTGRDRARHCAQAARPPASTASSGAFPSPGASPNPPKATWKALPTLQFYFNNDVTLFSFRKNND